MNDPVLLASHRSLVGFRWDDVPRYVDLTSVHRQITADARKGGMGQGFTVPAHVPGEANGSCSFAMRPGRALPERSLHFAQLVGSFAFQAARTLVLNARNVPVPGRGSAYTPDQRPKAKPQKVGVRDDRQRQPTDWAA